MGAKQVGGCTARRLSCYDSADLYFFGKTGVPVCRPGIGGVGLFSASVFSIIYSLSFQEFPTKMNQISGLMITAVAGGGVVTPLLGMALDFAGVTAGLSVILLCVLYLIYCAFGVKIQS